MDGPSVHGDDADEDEGDEGGVNDDDGGHSGTPSFGVDVRMTPVAKATVG
jgi:hypothetical protein